MRTRNPAAGASRSRLAASLVAALAIATAVVAHAHAADEESSAIARPTQRCGWFVNPSPGNAWLDDRDGRWIVGAQGGHRADGDWPVFADEEWILTSRSYGYGCACLTVVADPQSHEVLRIVESQVRPPKACRDDRALKKRSTPADAPPPRGGANPKP